MNVALYARVSSEKQAENDLSIPGQLKALRVFAKKNGYVIFEEFIDIAESAKTANRPAFQKMIGFAKTKDPPFEQILVWKFSRFARNREDAIIYKSLLKKRGVSVISINEPVDNSPAGNLLEGMIEVIDEFYSQNLAEDTKRGLKENASRGFHNGSTPIGYKTIDVKDGEKSRKKLAIDDKYSPIIRRIFKLYVQYKGLKEIANILNNEGLKTKNNAPWRKAAISYILKNPVYKGTYVYGRNNDKDDEIIIENNHEAIVDKQLFDKAQEILNSRSSDKFHPREINSTYLLSGLITCGKCGAKMTGHSAKSGKNHYYTCQNYSKCGKSVCDAKSINKKKIEGTILLTMLTNIFTEENLRKLHNVICEKLKKHAKEQNKKTKYFKNEINKINKKLNNLYSTIEKGNLEAEFVYPRIRKLSQQKSQLEKEKNRSDNEYKSSTNNKINIDTIIKYAKNFKNILGQCSLQEKKVLIKSFINEIVVNPDEIKIKYKFPIVTCLRDNKYYESSAYGTKSLLGWDSNPQPSG